jgi:hypothetical protein
MSNFITNTQQKQLRTRLSILIKESDEPIQAMIILFTKALAYNSGKWGTIHQKEETFYAEDI